MGKLIIVVGDSTDHGGTVISGSPLSGTVGRRWARKGDMVACPRCKGVFPIVEGDLCLLSDGAPVAYDGCKVACGATLIGGKQTLSSTDHVHLAPPPSIAGAGRVGNIGEDKVAGYEDEILGAVEQRFRGRFQVLDRVSGEPIANVPVRIRSTDGQTVMGLTDKEGYTQWVERTAADALAFDLAEEQQ